MQKTLLLFLISLFTCKLYAQNYTRDAGIRIDNSFYATYRQYQDDDQALEGMLCMRRNGITLAIMKEYFQPFVARHVSENLYFEYGFGAHIGFRVMRKYKVLNRTYVLEERRFNPLLGINGLVGLEYRFPEFPFVVGVDIKPYFEYSVVQIFDLYLHSVGVSIKYKF